MSNLKRIVQQLSAKDYQSLYHQLAQSGAEKSTFLLRSLRESRHQNRAIIKALGINTNAYYTLRSRLSQKIEDHLVSLMETPRAHLLKKIASLSDVVFTNKRTLAIATLKKMEKELLDYDLSNELAMVYKHLKKLHLYDKEGFEYTRRYNRQVAYTLAMDKAEDSVHAYFKTYGDYYLGAQTHVKEALNLLKKEINGIQMMYDSHRLYIYNAMVTIFHRLHVEDPHTPSEEDAEEPTENILAKVQGYLQHYAQDATYYHFNLLFDLLQLEYYDRYGIYRKADSYYTDLVLHLPRLLSSYPYYSFPSHLLSIILRKAMRAGKEATLADDNERSLRDYEPNENDTAAYVAYVSYRALCCYYANRYEEAVEWLSGFLAKKTLKNYPEALMNLKILLATHYVLLDDYDLFMQTLNSVQRLLRLVGKEKAPHIAVFVKVLRVAMNQGRKRREDKVLQLIEAMPPTGALTYNPLGFLRLNAAFAENLCKIRVAHN